jgi:aminomethyltransferase
VKRTPLFHGHVAAGAKLVDFAGWEMPIQYSGVVDEYQTVRSAAGLFDVSHMGRLLLSGAGALSFLQRVATNDASKLAVLESHYSMVCNQAGGIKDDIFVYRIKPDQYYLCVNASNREKILAWLQEQAAKAERVTIEDRSVEVSQLALQGPASRDILTQLGVSNLADVKARRCLEAKLAGAPSLITRTGYTGELGYELYVPKDRALAVWTELLTVGKAAGLKPAGLGSRDLLRLEMAYLLYGNDISEETSPIEAGADWVVNFDKGEFIGGEVLKRQKVQGVTRRLAAFELLEKAVPRHGLKVLADGGKPVGEVTSGNLSPLLQKGIGLAYVPPALAKAGTKCSVDIRGRVVPAVVVKPPFYQRRPS